ncbi:hypothetical protein DL95DRAFT_463583 [Leptodontidium sp. 2 PMI_412]|nr:hypothetical protein DL95DRAFT_463583 [Leptodontidium sp. 2 PMI_412]
MALLSQQPLFLYVMGRKRYLGACLIYACKNGHLNAVRTLVAAEAPINGNTGINPPIPRRVAEDSGYPEIVAFLMANGAHPDLDAGLPVFPND